MKKTAIIAVALAMISSTALAQSYPSRPITLLVPFAAGGPTDTVARVTAQSMSKLIGQPIIIENALGAGGTIAATRVARASPDGYTLLMGNLGTQAASVGLYPNLAYDPRTDFAPIMNAAATPMLVAAKNDLPVKDFREFVAYVKANAAKLNYGTGGVGATSHLTCLFLDTLLDVKVQHVPFRGSGPALNALLAGQIDYVCDQTVGIVPQIEGGTVKGIALLARARSSLMPTLATAEEQGLKDFEAITWTAFFLPKGTPPEIVDKLHAATVQMMDTPALAERMRELGVTLVPSERRSPQYLADFVAREIEKWGAPIKAAGIHAD